jgi:hypothetical protein
MAPIPVKFTTVIGTGTCPEAFPTVASVVIGAFAGRANEANNKRIQVVVKVFKDVLIITD